MQATFKDYVVDEHGNYVCRLESANPAPYSHSDFYVTLVPSEMQNINANQLGSLLDSKMAAKYGGYDPATGYGQGHTLLNGVKGRVVTVS